MSGEERKPLTLLTVDIRDILGEIKSDVHDLSSAVGDLRVELAKINTSGTRDDIDANTKAITELQAAKNRAIGYAIAAATAAGGAGSKLFELIGG